MEKVLREWDWQIFVESYLNFNIGVAILLFALLFGGYLLIIKKQKRKFSVSKLVFGLLWSGYLVIVLTGTFLNRNIGDGHYLYLEPFWSYKAAMEDGMEEIVWQIIYNVVMFIPWGIFLAFMWDSMKNPFWNIGSALIASVFIELMQFVLKCGTVEFDDLFHNVLGAITGYGFWTIYWEIKTKKDSGE